MERNQGIGKQDLEAILNSTEQVALQIFVDNQVQFNAVKKVLLFKLRSVGVFKPGEPPIDLGLNFAFQAAAQGKSKEEIGEDIMAKWEGARIVENAFDQLQWFKKIEKGRGNKENPAR